MTPLEVVGALTVGVIGLGCVLALIAGVVGWELEARHREREAQSRREARDLEWLDSRPSARVER